METSLFPALYLIPVLPLLGAATLALFGTSMSRVGVNLVALSACFGAFAVSAVSVVVFVRAGAPLEQELWTWIASGRYRFGLTLGLDQLSGVLILVVTGVGFLIHVYSVEYMHDDPGYHRFFAYLNLFIFAMSVLVLGRNLPVLFIGWEGVGLASYLLIGFWYRDADKAAAGKKAFIVNRIGDFGFLVGTFTLVALFGTADFYELRGAVAPLTDLNAEIRSGVFEGYSIRGMLTFACISLFVGATGKSAQIPLFVWLPDAMAGPTPVSALIHAATMVTAGVYMVCRLFFIYDTAPAALDVVAWIGGLTAIFAATIGLAQNDIKKVLAYSTVSQLGYMFLAAGLGAYGVAIFHLVTHAFFKACLFLGSGAVIHALHGEQDMRNMGGLRTKLPVVYWTFLLSTLALAGVFPFAGFFSKDAILAYAWQENRALWVLGFLGAGLTALYMSRLVSLTFYGDTLRLKDEHGHEAHLHAPSWITHMPLIVLALLAVVGGALSLPKLMAGGAGLWLEHYLEPATRTKALTLSHATEWVLMGVSVAWAVAGLVVGYVIYRHGPSEKMAAFTKAGAGRLAHLLLHGKWFVDELYQFLIVAPLKLVASFFAYLVDPFVVDGILVKASGWTLWGAGKAVARLQTGNVQAYMLVLVLSVAAVLLWVI